MNATSELRVLSIRQPWAELILAHGKDIENRTWTTSWRGLLVIHASKQWDLTGAATATTHGVRLDRDLATGYLGVVELTDVHPDTGCCRPWGQPDTHHWRLTNPRRFPAPIPAPGRLGLHKPAPPTLPRLDQLITELDDTSGRGERDE